MSEIAELIAKLKKEAKDGGELTDLPCPMCGRPRSRRSDYTRCTPCGVNWLDGEDLSANPKVARYEKMKADQLASQWNRSKSAGNPGTK